MIRWVEIDSGSVWMLPWKNESTDKTGLVDPYAITSTPSSQLIFSCTRTHLLYRYDLSTGEHEALSDPNTFTDPDGVVVVESERCAYVVDSSMQLVRHMTLPALFF